MRKSHLLKNDAFIDGVWQHSPSRFPVTNPATHEIITEVADTTADMARAAVQAAHQSFENWRSLLASERAAILLRWADLLQQNLDDLAALMTSEQGKPLAEARGEIQGGVESIRWSAQAAREDKGYLLEPFKAGTGVQILKEAVGVCVAITPWNFPVGMITRKVSPALAAGCTMVLKPAEDTPLCALTLAALAEQAGLPPGVFNVVPCSRENAAPVGQILCTHPLVRKISFTGSTATGKILAGYAADGVKRITLELGGNAPFLIYESADLSRAADGLIASKFRNAGQTCICANRIFVQQSIWDEFVPVFAAKVSGLCLGNGADPGVQVGPLINEAALAKIGGWVDKARMAGAGVACGGKPSDKGRLFYEPSIVTGLSPTHLLHKEEIFGPVASLCPFKDEAESISLANDTEYGLAAYLYTQDPAQADRVGRALDYGMVGINEPILAHASIPFGGRKSSGYGREGGPDCLAPFQDIKYILRGI